MALLDQEERQEPGRCGTALAGRPITAVVHRHVFDPPVKVTATEHQLIEGNAPAGTAPRPAAPDGAEAPVQYGPRIAAIIIYLYAGQFLSKKRRAQAVAELFGVPPSSATRAALAVIP